MGFFDSLMHLIFNDRDNERKHKEKMEQISSDTQVTITKDTNKKDEHISFFNNGADVTKTYLYNRKNNSN